MSLPEPVPGMVIRHAFLWSHEAAQGRTEGVKARPCAVIVAARRTDTGAVRVTVAPITHTSPQDETACVEVTDRIKGALGLDNERQWLRFDELNSFDWPGFDLSPIPGTDRSYTYGMLPKAFFDQARNAIVDRIRQRAPVSNVDRDS